MTRAQVLQVVADLVAAEVAKTRAQLDADLAELRQRVDELAERQRAQAVTALDSALTAELWRLARLGAELSD